MEEISKLAQTSQASLDASAKAHEKAAQAQESMAATSKAISQSMAAKALADGIRLQMEHLKFLQTLDDSEENKADIRAGLDELKRLKADHQQLISKLSSSF
jgi:hypothetical protein